MLLLIAFAFLAGVITILSPCILPVLPVILSGTVGGRWRPWGVITGFVVSFTTLTLALSALVSALGFNPDLLRWVAAGLIASFGLVLVVPALKDVFQRAVTSLVSRQSSGTPKLSKGYGGGVILGLGLGVVWTPCVGPIMASVISLALSQTVDAGSVLITISYAVGTSIPLFLLMVGGRGLLARFPWFSQHSEGLQRGFGVLMLVTASALFTGADRSFSNWLLTVFPSYGSGLTALEAQEAVNAELAKRRSGPANTSADPLTLGEGTWINSAPLSLAGLKGKVVLVDFWTYSCVNCVRTLPYLRAWHEAYKDKGLVIVGVHSPEFAFERSEANLRQAMSELKVTWPVVQDNAFGIWNAYGNQYWPAHYLYGRDGTLLDTHFGEGAYEETEAAIARALGVAVAPTAVKGVVPISEGPKTPETYLGYGRGARYASREDVVTDAVGTYSVPAVLEVDHWALGGRWTVASQYSRAEAGAVLKLNFQGARVYLVLSPPAGRNGQVTVRVDGGPASVVKIDAEKMYTLVDEAGRTAGVLELTVSEGVQAYAFTFG